MNGAVNDKNLLCAFDLLSRTTGGGTLLLNSDGSIALANAVAINLLGAQSEPELKARWDATRPLAEVDVRNTNESKPLVVHSNIEVGESRRNLSFEIHCSGKNDDGYIALVKDRRTVEKMELNLLMASHARAMFHLHGQLVHDLRSPLHAMQITLELLSGNFPAVGEDKEFETRQLRYVGVLKDEITRLNRGLQSALDQNSPPSKIQQAFDIRDLIKEIVALLSPQARRQRVELSVQMPEKFLHAVGYPDRIKQALLNIMVSRLEIMSHGGALSIAADINGTMIEIVFDDNRGPLPVKLVDDIHRFSLPCVSDDQCLLLYTARVVFESHGGNLIVDQSSDDHCRIKLQLPFDNAFA